MLDTFFVLKNYSYFLRIINLTNPNYKKQRYLSSDTLGKVKPVGPKVSFKTVSPGGTGSLTQCCLTNLCPKGLSIGQRQS